MATIAMPIAEAAWLVKYSAAALSRKKPSDSDDDSGNT